MVSKTTHNPQETIDLAKKIMAVLPTNINTIALSGDLAAGKTTFTKGIGEFLGVKKVINSPTFTILKIYEGSKRLCHFDFYRLFNSAEDLGFEEYINDENDICVIEWPMYKPDLLPAKYLLVDFENQGDDVRKISIKTIGGSDDWLVNI